MRRLLLLAGAVLLAGCRLQLDVHVEMREDGGGTVDVVVGVDGDGIDRIGGDLQSVLVVDDLEAAGWTVDPPDEDADGFTRVHFRKAFDSPAAAAAIFEEIAGEDGPFQAFALSHDSSFARSEWSFTGRIDSRGGLEAFGDDALAAELDGEPLGQTVEEIETQLGESLSDVIRLGVEVQLPGDVASNAPEGTSGRPAWTAAFGGEAVDMQAIGEATRPASVAGVAVAVVAAVVLVVYGLIGLVRRSMRRRRAVVGDDGGA